MKNSTCLLNAFLCASLLLAGCDSGNVRSQEGENVIKKLAKQLNESNSAVGKKVAVFDFQVYGGLPADEGLFAGESLGHELGALGKISLIERSQLASILKEQELGHTGFVENGDAIKVGKLMAAEVVIVGSVYKRDLGGTGTAKTYLARMIESRTGRILSTAYSAEKPVISATSSASGRLQSLSMASVSTSSYLTEPHIINYPENTIDGNEGTVWVDGDSNKSAKGEYIHYNFSSPVSIKKIRMLNGYTRVSKVYGDLYWLNRAVKTIMLTYSNGRCQYFNFNHTKRWQERNLVDGLADSVTSVTLTILDEFEGKKWNDTCIAEVVFMGNAK